MIPLVNTGTYRYRYIHTLYFRLGKVIKEFIEPNGFDKVLRKSYVRVDYQNQIFKKKIFVL